MARELDAHAHSIKPMRLAKGHPHFQTPMPRGGDDKTRPYMNMTDDAHLRDAMSHLESGNVAELAHIDPALLTSLANTEHGKAAFLKAFNDPAIAGKMFSDPVLSEHLKTAFGTTIGPSTFGDIAAHTGAEPNPVAGAYDKAAQAFARSGTPVAQGPTMDRAGIDMAHKQDRGSPRAPHSGSPAFGLA